MHMRIVLLAVDDEFAGEMQRSLYESHPHWIVGSVISSCAIYKHSTLGAVLLTVRTAGLVFLLEMIRIKIVRRLLERKRRFLPSQLARTHGVEQFVSANINDEDGVAKLRSWDPDLIISTNFSHYLGKTVRESIAEYGCWNLHKSLLPHYRGMAPSFHALLEGSSKVGASLHVVSRGFDSGEILGQIEVPVTDADSVYSLNRKTSQAGGQLLASFLETFDPGTTRATPQPEGDWKNYTYPTRTEVRAFRTKGLRFYTPDDETILATTGKPETCCSDTK
jgi:folate-dependent phosphoribosylglycinamide formyltransferase PurN